LYHCPIQFPAAGADPADHTPICAEATDHGGAVVVVATHCSPRITIVSEPLNTALPVEAPLNTANTFAADVICVEAAACAKVRKFELDVAEADTETAAETVRTLVLSDVALPTALTRASNGLTRRNALEAVFIA
jgi:hypothetical protein